MTYAWNIFWGKVVFLTKSAVLCDFLWNKGLPLQVGVLACPLLKRKVLLLEGCLPSIN
jgi:hypothetical protein